MSYLPLLLYGNAREVSNELSENPDEFSNDELTAALSNAMKRIADLEVQVENHGVIIERTEKIARKAANEASCLANGIKPD